MPHSVVLSSFYFLSLTGMWLSLSILLLFLTPSLFSILLRFLALLMSFHIFLSHK